MEEDLQKKPETSEIASSAFLVSERRKRSVLRTDAVMTRVIKVGGVVVIAAVAAICFFIIWQISPLFYDAQVTYDKSIALNKGQILAVGIDEWGSMPWVLTEDYRLRFVDAAQAQEVKTVDIHELMQEGERPVFHKYHPKLAMLSVCTDQARCYFLSIHFESEFRDGIRVVAPDVKVFSQIALVESLALTDSRLQVRSLDLAGDSDALMLALLIDEPTQSRIIVIRGQQKKTLLGGGQFSWRQPEDLTTHVRGDVDRILVNQQKSVLLVGVRDGGLYYFAIQDDQITKKQYFIPFKDLPIREQQIASLDFIFGGASIALTNFKGENRIFSLFRVDNVGDRLFGLTKSFPALPGPADFFFSSSRNKGFIIGGENYASWRYMTTGVVRWEEKLPFKARHVAINEKNSVIVFSDEESRVHRFILDDPHPEAGFAAFFSKIWYEGAHEPSYQWQSTGGSDEFEAKISMIPLLVGTLKGTFYALLFSLPLSILAAIYTSQFLHQKLRVIIKPAMEMMASFPSVILGFVGAMWLAPILETRVVSLMVILLLIPCVVFLFGSFSSWMEASEKFRVKPGYEFLVSIPVLLFVGWLGWQIGPSVEKALFTVTDPATGKLIPDFRLWWSLYSGETFEQRNALIVGIVMGFAVTPIIFTIAEDSLSSVPMGLKSASLALGASRWQTTMRVVVPTASAGIFSAIMIGVGRAVGETMIVVMATGNTPILKWGMFNGMRTLSANLAVELAEAPYQGTLFRALFLGALLLFAMTFILNTAAELLRQHLREKYKTI